MLVDANLLIYAAVPREPLHTQARDWLTEQLNGPRRVGMPWLSLSAFLRITTHPRASRSPSTPEQSVQVVREWLAAPPVWVPQPGAAHAEILIGLITTHRLRGNLITDAQLAALAIEHGLTVYSADTDFARFPELHWENPLASQ